MAAGTKLDLSTTDRDPRMDAIRCCEILATQAGVRMCCWRALTRQDHSDCRQKCQTCGGVPYSAQTEAPIVAKVKQHCTPALQQQLKG